MKTRSDLNIRVPLAIALGCDSEERFENIEDASNFWIELWETRGTGNKEAEWLSKIKEAIARKVPVPSEGSWRLECSEAVKCLLKKKETRAPQGLTALLTIGGSACMCCMRGSLKPSLPSLKAPRNISLGFLREKRDSSLNQS